MSNVETTKYTNREILEWVKEEVTKREDPVPVLALLDLLWLPEEKDE